MRLLLHTQLPHKVPCHSLGDFAVAMNVRRKVTTIAIFQNKVKSILSLQTPKTNITATYNYFSKKNNMQREPRQQSTGLYLDGLEKANDVRIVDGTENGNLFEQILTDFWAKLFPVNLLDSDLHTRVPVPGPPDNGEGARPDSRAKHVVPYQAGLVAGASKIHAVLQKKLKPDDHRVSLFLFNCGISNPVVLFWRVPLCQILRVSWS